MRYPLRVSSFNILPTLTMNQYLFDALARSRIVRNYVESFPIATGFVLKLQPTTGDREMIPFGGLANPFCNLVACNSEAKEVCKKTFRAIRDQVAETLAPGRSSCFAGLTHVAIPVLSGGDHIATIYGGQLMVQKPTKQAFEKVARKLSRLGLGDQLPALEEAWFNTPVVTEEQLQAITYLLETFAARISRYAATKILESSEGESASVKRAKDFMQSRFAEPLTMPDVARHLNMSPSTFGKMFKRESGLTFTQYLARFRVEKSKAMLVNPSHTIRTVAFQCGFDSISQFNRSFRQYTGMSPSEYRASLAGVDPSLPPTVDVANVA